MNYDIIGDIHGQYEKLTGLLKQLGYRDTGGAWRHTGRTAVFVGDLIDRGPRQVDTVALVRRMVEAETAYCLLGNHEFNAIAWATPDPDDSGEYLRRHSRDGNRHQHQAFLSEVEGTPLHEELIAWFKTLPLWLDLGGIRAVHACWNDDYMTQLSPCLGPCQTLTDDLILTGSREGHWSFLAIEALCKGLEIDLPQGISFHDKDGQVRRKMRIRWWEKDLSTFRKAALVDEAILDRIPDDPMPPDSRVAVYDGPPVFFGHYWRKGEPILFAPNIACVDYSAGKDGPLVAYRWEGESVLSQKGFVYQAM